MMPLLSIYIKTENSLEGRIPNSISSGTLEKEANTKITDYSINISNFNHFQHR